MPYKKSHLIKVDKVVIIINIKKFLKAVAFGAMGLAFTLITAGYTLLIKQHNIISTLVCAFLIIGAVLLWASGWIFVASQAITINDLENDIRHQKQSDDRIDGFLKNNLDELQTSKISQTSSKI